MGRTMTTPRPDRRILEAIRRLPCHHNIPEPSVAEASYRLVRGSGQGMDATSSQAGAG